MCRYGYVRVSTKDQNPDRQFEALLSCGVRKRNIYTDMLSGKDFNRGGYKNLVRHLRKGDVLVIKSVDRLGRNYDEIIKQWRYLTRNRRVDIEVLDFPLLNTNQVRDGLTGIFIADLVLQIMAYFAQVEREFIKQRQVEGIAIARAKGANLGRERNEIPRGFEKSRRLWKSGKLTLRQAADKAGMSYSTFYRRCKEVVDE